MSAVSQLQEQVFDIETLRTTADGLLFPSETDAPLVPFFWPNEKPETLTSERLAELAKIHADTPIKVVPLGTLFRPVVKEQEWHNDEEAAEVKKFQNLVQAIKSTLTAPKVFCVGEVSIDIYIVGKVEGGWAGLKTHIVET